MPTYAYRCKSCGHEFEELQKISDDPIRVCPKCSKESVVRIISGAGLLFKGSGFYLTDYKKTSSSTSATTPSTENPATKKEKKPAPKKDGSSAPSAPSES